MHCLPVHIYTQTPSSFAVHVIRGGHRHLQIDQIFRCPKSSFCPPLDVILYFFLALGGVPSAWAALLVSWLGGDRAGEQPRLPIGWSRLRCLVGQLQVQNFYACNLLKTKQNYFELEANVELRLIFRHGVLTTWLYGFTLEHYWISPQLNLTAWDHLWTTEHYRMGLLYNGTWLHGSTTENDNMGPQLNVTA